MRTIGYVVTVNQHRAKVVLGRHAECTHCGACLAGLEDKRRTLEAVNAAGAGVGQRVEVEVPPSWTIGAAFLLFILPLIAALAGGILGYRLGVHLRLGPVLGAVVLAGGAVVLVFLGLRRLEAYGSGSRLARITRILPSDQPSEGGC
jgi:sigma-E factor negative regulatory protein RseC